MKLLIATWNPAKLLMFQNLLKNFEGIDFFCLSDFPEVEEPEEDWKTPQENAYIKAQYYSNIFDIPTLADDAWFEIEDLWWAPWVKARRWWWELPVEVSDEDFIKHYLEKIKDINKEIVKGAFPFSRCLYINDKEHYFQNEVIDLYLSKTPRRPFKKWWPISSVNIMPDWRHFLDVPDDDPLLYERLKKEWLFELIKNLK